MSAQITTQLNTNPRIYVACLAAYNNGYLHGKWIEVSGCEKELELEIKEIIDTSTAEYAEEWAIHDHEGFEGYHIAEYMSIPTICRIAELMNENGNFPSNVVASLIQDFGTDSVNEWLEDHFVGSYKDMEDYAYEYLESSGELSNLPESLQYYFDYKAYARDLDLNGDIITIDGNDGLLYIFNNY